jgi:phosphotransferase system HPr (HPr) family protein
MDEGPPIARRRALIVNTYGLHMRPSTRFVNLAASFQSEVSVGHNGRRANGKSILDMTSLAAERGSDLEIEARGPDAEAAVQALEALVAAGFHMEEEPG